MIEVNCKLEHTEMLLFSHYNRRWAVCCLTLYTASDLLHRWSLSQVRTSCRCRYSDRNLQLILLKRKKQPYYCGKGKMVSEERLHIYTVTGNFASSLQ